MSTKFSTVIEHQGKYFDKMFRFEVQLVPNVYFTDQNTILRKQLYL